MFSVVMLGILLILGEYPRYAAGFEICLEIGI